MAMAISNRFLGLAATGFDTDGSEVERVSCSGIFNTK